MAVLDMSANVDAFATHTITRKRPAAPVATDGRFAEPTTTDVTMAAIVQPLPGKEAIRLGLGEREKDAVSVMVAAGTIEIDDVLVIDADTYGVISIESWRTAAAYDRSACLKRVAA